MNRYIRTILSCFGAIIVILICRVAYCAEYQFEDNYTSSQEAAWTAEANSIYDGGSALRLYTRDASEEGYYVEYSVSLEESGAYKLTVDCTELGGNVYSEVYVSVNGGELYNLYTCTGVGVTQSSGFDRLTLSCLPGFIKGNNTLRFTVLNPRPRDSLYIAYLDCFSLEKSAFAVQSIDITGDTAYNIVEQGNSVGVTLDFSAESEEDTLLNITLSDYYDNTIFNSDYKLAAGDSSLSVDFGILEKGHYTLLVKSSESILAQSFISVVTPLNKRIKFSDTPFGIDTAFSIVAPQENIDDNLMAFKLTGASWMRDRLILSSISKTGDTWNFGGSYSDEVLTKASELGIKTHVMLQSFPSSILDADSSGNSEYITKDYVALYDLMGQMANYYDGRVTTFQIFNEPDTHVGSADNETGDKFAHFVQSAALGIYDSEVEVGVTAPGYSAVRTEPLEIALRNKLFSYVDVGAYHNHQTYSSEYDVQKLKISPTKNYNRLINSYGYIQNQNWLDEAGISMGSSDGASLSASEQRKQASYYVMSTCEGLANGADKMFSYLFHDKRSRFSWFSRYNEGPNRVYTAYSVMTDVLGEGECLGTVDCFDGVEGYAFKNGARQILVLRSAEKTDIDIPVSASSVEIIKADGSSSVKYPGSKGYITTAVSTDPIFVSIIGEYDNALYTARNNKINDFEIEQKSISETDRIIIHQIYPSETRANAKYDGYQLQDETVVAVEVSNLNSSAKDGIIYAEVFSGWQISPAQQNVSVDAHSSTTIYFTVSKTDAVTDNRKSAVVFKGEFDGEYTTESVTEIVYPGEIKYQQIDTISSLLNLSDWKKSACSGTVTSITSTESGLSFKFDFPVSASDKWAYPYFNFSESQDFSQADGLLIQYNSSENFSDYENLTFGVWLGEKDGGRYINKYAITLNKGENVLLIPFSEFTYKNGTEIDNILTTDNINYISVGVNSKANVLDIPEFTILDFGLYHLDEIDDFYAKISSVEFCNPSSVKSKYGCVKVCFTDGSLSVNLSSVRVFVDNIECPVQAYGRDIYAVLPSGIYNGEHNVYISYSCEDTKAFYTEFTLSSENFAVWSEPKQVIWYTEAENINESEGVSVEFVDDISALNGNYAKLSLTSDSMAEYLFEIPVDGYYALYAVSGDTESDKYAECKFEIPDMYMFSLEDAHNVDAYTDMSYFLFDSVYLPKGEYQLHVSKETDAASGLLALDYLGLIYDYEVVSRVEAEEYVDISFDNYGTATSGGAVYLYANSKSEQDGGSYSVTYTISVPNDGEYILCANTAPTDSLYYSPYRFEIDNEIIVNSHYSEKAGADIGDLKSYKYGEVYLTAGEHTIKLVVENRRMKGSPLGYYLWIDCIELRTKTPLDNSTAKYASLSVNLENIYDYSVYPNVFWKIYDEIESIVDLDIIKQSEVQPGDKALKIFTVEDPDEGSKAIYIWDRVKELYPLCKAVLYD